MKITALLVTHDGETWLPRVLAAVERSTRVPDQVVAVDTGSSDDSAALVRGVAAGEVVRLGAEAGYPAAVRAGLATLPPVAAEDEWVWLLHDDGAPAANCLAVLAEAAAAAPADVAAVGPKLREWPSQRRLLEVGVTVSSAGRRVTGVEAGEYDHGQHDEVSEVLAVNTAGMLVRRDVLERLGLDDQLPVFGNDLDFGWRAARAGHRILVVPEAVLFHAGAAARGRRQGVARPRAAERAAEVHLVLANGRGVTLPFRAARLLLVGLLRVFAVLLVRAPAEGRDELVGLVRGLQPGALVRGRRERRVTAVRPHGEVRHLLAPWWLPYRQGLDSLADVGAALGDSRRGQARRRSPDAGRLAGLLGSPGAWAVLVSVVLALIAARHVLGGAALHGGALLPAPDRVGHWWGLWWRPWHWIGHGTDAPAPPYVLPLAVAATVLFAHPGWLISVLFVLCVPVSLWGAMRLLRRVVAGEWTAVWGAAAYALVPVLCGAVGQGRLGTVVAAALLPWVAGAALGLAAEDPARRWRAAWRTALGIGLLAAFAPTAWLLSLLLVCAAPLLGGRKAGAGRLLVIAVLPLLLLAPWAIATVGSPGAWLVEAGRPASVPVLPGGFDLLLGRATGPGSAPAWLSVGLPLAAAVALLRRDTRRKVLRVWVAALATALLLVLTATVLVHLPGVPFGFRAWPGFLLVALQGCFVLAAALAGDGLLHVMSTARFGWQQPVAALVTVAAVGAVVAGAAWWVVAGTPGLLTRQPDDAVPTYMAELSAQRNTSGVLVLSGGGDGVKYRLLRHGDDRLGDDGVLALTRPDPRLTALVGRLLSTDPGTAADALAGYGISYVYAPAPAHPAVTAALDAAGGLTGASAPRPSTRAWQLTARPTLPTADPSGPWHRPLLVLQLLVLLTAVILALPRRREAR